MRVLVIDDDELLLRALSGVMRLQGFEVETASSPERAYMLLEASPFDGALVDLMMPRANGLEMIRGLRARAPKLHIVLTSSFPMSHGQIERLGLEDVKFIPKPASPEALRDAFGVAPLPASKPVVATNSRR